MNDEMLRPFAKSSLQDLLLIDTGVEGDALLEGEWPSLKTLAVAGDGFHFYGILAVAAEIKSLKELELFGLEWSEDENGVRTYVSTKGSATVGFSDAARKRFRELRPDVKDTLYPSLIRW